MNPKFLELYKTIGGESQLQAILDRFYEKMQEDVLIGFFFSNKDIRKIARMQKAFLMKAWGIEKEYTGKKPNEAHEELPPILKGHFDRRIVLLRQTLEEHKIPEDFIKVWIKFESGFRKVIQT